MKIQDEKDRLILEILKRSGEKLSISQLHLQMGDAVARRTLQRRVNLLVATNLVQYEGEKKGRRYFLDKELQRIPVSSKGTELRKKVALPLNQRSPVGYNANFLYDYIPNETYYLSESIRKHLHKAGCQSNIKLEPGTYVKQIFHRLLIDLSWNSSRLEGNTYSLLETERLVELGIENDAKSFVETQMILNHKAAIEFMLENIAVLKFNRHVILNLHGLLSNNLLQNPKARGQLRMIPVGIGQSVYHPPETPQLIEQCFDKILTNCQEIKDPFEQAFFCMVHLPYLQPFEDVNKRVSRLAANIPFFKANLSPISFIGVGADDYISAELAVYELNEVPLLRDVFVWAYERSAKEYVLMQNTLGEPDLIQLKYRKVLSELIHRLVTRQVHGRDLLQEITLYSEKTIPPKDRMAFARICEREIASLHEGNIAIYKIAPGTFTAWKINKN